MEDNQVAVTKGIIQHEVDNCGIIFWVKGDADAQITLLSDDCKKIVTVILGASGNTITSYYEEPSSALNTRQQNLKVNLKTPQILSASEYKLFGMSWMNAEFKLGLIGEKALTTGITYKSLSDVKYIQLSDNVHWKIESRPPPPVSSIQYFEGGEEYWVPFEGKMPEDAFIGGHYEEPLFVVRAKHMGSLTPGYCKLSMLKAVIPHGYKSWVIDNFEILCGYNFEWIKTHGSRIPSDAVIGGYSEVRREPLFIIRVSHNGHLIVGKAHRLHHLGYIPWESKEIDTVNFEVLVSRSSKPYRGGIIPKHAERGFY